MRQEVIDVMCDLQEHLIKHHSDDHKSLSKLISAYDHAQHFFGISRSEFKHHQSSARMIKMSLDNRLKGSKKTIRPLLIDRVMIQHESRLNEAYKTEFTETHEKVLRNLFQLATSNYAGVRIRAQDSLLHMTSTYAYSYKVVLDPLLQLLSGDNSEEKVSHEAFKGEIFAFEISFSLSHSILELESLFRRI